MKVTAETITDEQIREMRMPTGWQGPVATEWQRTFSVALAVEGAPGYRISDRRDARARCAEIWNARHGGDK